MSHLKDGVLTEINKALQFALGRPFIHYIVEEGTLRLLQNVITAMQVVQTVDKLVYGGAWVQAAAQIDLTKLY